MKTKNLMLTTLYVTLTFSLALILGNVVGIWFCWSVAAIFYELLPRKHWISCQIAFESSKISHILNSSYQVYLAVELVKKVEASSALMIYMPYLFYPMCLTVKMYGIYIANKALHKSGFFKRLLI